MNLKQVAGEKAASYIKDGMIVGLGTGSTAYYFTKKIGELVKEGLKVKCIPTSKDTKKLAKEWNIPLTELAQVDHIDVTVDGADEVDPDFNLIKGGGGALLREKIIAYASKKLIIVVDKTKMVEILGKFPLPVEVTTFAWENTLSQIERLGCKATLRRSADQPFITDNDNYILDCQFDKIENPAELNSKLNQIPGVVENGLFIDMADLVVVGKDTTVEIVEK
ncbi:ribose-5-phosphate isomerase [Orenia metallireducens]|jgi:ribose 5-phosphate isomerase A|uniref:Ribose-5-phosphate isomerase A n=1 Tax=Orenia metallireducens TaxID=1413210 RepID=A0A285IFR1_9FIRM|nr:ribose-5-phosphate isomerase RpiA [Orenia metallireducens]PRX18165.1 ribose-5-phosphate isomerase [Orenia metallireducens]SNY46805.1 ribose-5-phosphate isomerase [Orenia metallireducens]